MTFLHPEAWFWAMLAVPLVLVRLRRRPPRSVAVATGFLWQQVLAPGSLRSRWMRWRPVASVVTDLAVLLSIVAAMAEPAGGRAWSIALIVAALAMLTLQAYLYQQRWMS